MKRISSNASALTSASPHQATTLLGSSASEMPSSLAITCAAAARRLLRQVRAAKNEPRWAASCTLSENAMTLRSSLWREAKSCASAVLSRLEARAPRMMSASEAPQNAQSRLKPLAFTDWGRNTRTNRFTPQPGQLSASGCAR